VLHSVLGWWEVLKIDLFCNCQGPQTIIVLMLYDYALNLQLKAGRFKTSDSEVY